MVPFCDQLSVVMMMVQSWEYAHITKLCNRKGKISKKNFFFFITTEEKTESKQSSNLLELRTHLDGHTKFCFNAKTFIEFA